MYDVPRILNLTMPPPSIEPLFRFPEIPDDDKFVFEKLTSENFSQLYLMFEGDDSPFTDEQFKTYQGAESFARLREAHGAYTAKHGGQDWLFRLKSSGQYAGILHLYDLSLETFGENNKRCWIGFALRPDLRSKGIMMEALRTFIGYVLDTYSQIHYLHAMTAKENLAAQKLLLRCGFDADPEQRLSERHCFFVKKR